MRGPKTSKDPDVSSVFMFLNFYLCHIPPKVNTLLKILIIPMFLVFNSAFAVATCQLHYCSLLLKYQDKKF